MALFWKRFGEKVTGLKNNQFNWARLKLTFFFTVIITGLIVIYLFALFNEFNRDVRTFANENINIKARRERFIKNSIKVVGIVLFQVEPEDLTMVGVVVVISYALATITLRPIKKTMQFQKEFLANASHELRTPLTIVKIEFEKYLRNKKNYTKNGDLMIRKRADVLSNLEEIDRMGRIIEDLLLITRIDADQDSYRFNKIDIVRLIRKCKDNLNPYATHKQIKLILNTPSSIYMTGDPDNLYQVLLNIMKNAVDYSLPKTRVTINVVKLGDTIIIKISDQGVGISEKELPYIFDRFYRSQAPSIKKEGLGVGLAIAKRIIEKHKGNIQVESKIKKGTTFTISLPFEQTS